MLPLALNAQFGTPYPRSARFDTDIEVGVLELSAIITSDMLDLNAIVRHGTIGKASEDILHFILVEDYMHPSIS